MIRQFTSLLYHALDAEDAPAERTERGYIRYVVPVDRFTEQMRYLASEGFHSLQASEILALLKNGDRPPAHAVHICFDDGHVTNYTHAWPRLQQAGFRADFFVTADWVGKPFHMNWAQLRELSDAGCGIGSHGLTHHFLSDLDQRGIREELRVSKSRLEDGLARSVYFLSIPGGRYNECVRREAIAAGYKLVFTSKPGANSSRSDPYAMRRLAIFRQTDLVTFAQTAEAELSYVLRIRLRVAMLSGLKQLLGSSGYEQLRERILRSGQ